MKNDCLFCAIAAGEIPSSKVYEDEICFAFYDIAPQAPVHFLVIPKEHIGSVAEISGENSSVVAHIFEVIARVARELGLESYRVVSNIGEQAGQSVHHLHFHVLSGRDMTWPPGWSIGQEESRRGTPAALYL
jgi:histidine triad (HIT) family protein